MTSSSRLEDLRRRVERDPASIAFAQLGEEYRRAGEFHQAVEVCRAGLAIHPGYLSARVTLGRALIELNHLEEAQAEIEHVLASAPDNLAAIRGLAEIYHRSGERTEALRQYRAALALAPNDPDLEETVNDLERELAPNQRSADPVDGLTLEQATQAFAQQFPPAPPPAPEPGSPGFPEPDAPAASVEPELQPIELEAPPEPIDFALEPRPVELVPEPEPVVELTAERPASAERGPDATREARTIAALEAWLSAIDVARTHGQS